MSPIIKMLIAIVKPYLIHLASKELLDWIVEEALKIAVKSTKTPYDDELLKRILEEKNKSEK